MAITGFPSGGYNFQAKTPNVATDSTNSTSLVDVVNISGSGLLTSVHQRASGTTPASGYLKIILDGVTILDYSSTSFSVLGIYLAPTLNFAHKFNSSLQIQHSASSGDSCTTIVTYLTN